MIILDYDARKHRQIIHACVLALKDGKTVVYPTDTSYGLACDMTNQRAIKRLYRLKGRDFNKLMHEVVPSVAYAKKVGIFNGIAHRLSRKFWPGPLTIVVPKRTGKATIGLRYPKNRIALDLAKRLGRPISATSANRSGQKDSYSLSDILDNFSQAKIKPDIIINAGKLPRKRPSTLVRLRDGQVEILRKGPVSKKQIEQAIK